MITLAAALLQAALFRAPELIDGKIYVYESSGHKEVLDIAEWCDDLWVSPDLSTIAFITYKRQHRAEQSDARVERTSIYTANRLDHFKPSIINVAPMRINGRMWQVFRNPSVGSDGAIYFTVPVWMTTSLIFRLDSTSSRKPAYLARASWFCTIWGGNMSGGAVIMERKLFRNTGLAYNYRIWNRKEGWRTIRTDGSADPKSIDDWVASSGGVCR